MKQIVIRENSNFCQMDNKNLQRGAKVCGMPISPALNSFLEDVTPQAQKQRILTMFFAGNCASVEEVAGNDFDNEEEF